MGQALPSPVYAEAKRCGQATPGFAMGAAVDLQRNPHREPLGQWCGTEDGRFCRAQFSTCCNTEVQLPEETPDEPWGDGIQGASTSGAAAGGGGVCTPASTDRCEVTLRADGSNEAVIPEAETLRVPSDGDLVTSPEPNGKKVFTGSLSEYNLREYVSLLEAVPLKLVDANYRELSCPRGRYFGQVSSETGEFHGLGRLTMKDSTAVGVWQDGFLHGPGQEAWSDGRLYRGEFLTGAFSGHGRMQWHHPRGSMVYDGQYVEDRKHGWGRFTWPSGRTYEGQWICGRREGLGVETSAGSAKCSGLWEDNVFLSQDQDTSKDQLDEEGAAAAALASQRAAEAARETGLAWPEIESPCPLPRDKLYAATC